MFLYTRNGCTMKRSKSMKKNAKLCGALIHTRGFGNMPGPITCANPKDSCSTHGHKHCSCSIKDILKDIRLLVAEECNRAREDGFPTSRLTSLAVKIEELFK